MSTKMQRGQQRKAWATKDVYKCCTQPNKSEFFIPSKIKRLSSEGCQMSKVPVAQRLVDQLDSAGRARDERALERCRVTAKERSWASQPVGGKCTHERRPDDMSIGGAFAPSISDAGEVSNAASTDTIVEYSDCTAKNRPGQILRAPTPRYQHEASP